MATLDPQQRTLATRFSQVVTPLDFSPASWRPLPLAQLLAERCGGPSRLLHVDTASPWRGEPASKSHVNAPGGHAIEVDVLAASNPAEGIVQVLDELPPSLLVMSTHGHTAATEAVVGSVMEKVLQLWDGPIVAVGPHYSETRDLYEIVVGIEPSLPLPHRLLEDVRSWSEWLDLPVTVFGVTTDTLRAERSHQDRQLEQAAILVSRPAHPASVATFGAGSVPGNIVEFARPNPGTLIAVAPHVRSTATRMLLGSVAMAVCRRSTSPVLLRPYDALL